MYSYRSRILICVITTINGNSMRIYNVTNDPLVIIPLGKATLRTGSLRILHPINITQLEDVIMNNDEKIKNQLNLNALDKIVKFKVNKLHETFRKISPHSVRTKRWDSIGTAWKWIAGTPDAEDLHIINSTLNALIEQNNRQILINDKIDERIQDVTNIANNVLRLEEERLQERSYEIIQLVSISNIDLLQDYLETIEEAILLAKQGIPSSKLLSLADLNQMVTFLAEHDIHVATTEELLVNAKAQVSMNKTHVMYILKYPYESKETFEYWYIDSILKDKKRLFLNNNHIIKNQTHVYESLQPCEEKDNSKYLCDSMHLNPSTECIQRLVQGKHANCTYEKVYYNGLIKRINDEFILINDANITISSNCNNSTRLFNGSYLIQFENCSIYINNEEYPNLETTVQIKSFYSTLGLTATEIDTIDKPPTEYLTNMTLTNREKLQIISLQNDSLAWKINIFGSLWVTFPITIIGVAIFCFIYRCKRTTIRIEQQPATFTSTPMTFQALQRTLRTK
ncbi:uncharacterized protein LOC125767646 [Anopheles funestus]|uniref:uncharacterized protein LOC125767646 n=1 Tax=Anopheles funestus TaxID=62324 RepID=UPI0020C5FAAA|nr:uncharacterized protein LOC125767646 [Anopheles funestus]